MTDQEREGERSRLSFEKNINFLQDFTVRQFSVCLVFDHLCLPRRDFVLICLLFDSWIKIKSYKLPFVE